MIELVTGAPGSGKTTFAVSQRLLVEVERAIKTETGEEITRRLVCAGFRGLIIPHEKLPHKLTGEVVKDAVVDEWNAMAENDRPVHQRLPGAEPVECEALVQNWWLWCKPGDLIAIDEIQFVAGRGTMGRKPPYWIQALEIHRHYGVDFLVVSQHPQLIDTTIRNLVGMHRHVRSVLGSFVCMVYVWDHASNPERFALANKSTFVRRPKHYRLFHSSVAHVKPPTSGRAILWIVPVLVLALVIGISQFAKKFNPPDPKAAAKPVAPLVGLTEQKPRGVGAALASGGPVGPFPVVRGCVKAGPVCRCVGDAGEPLLLDQASCATAASGFTGFVRWAPRDAVAPPSVAASAAPPLAPPIPSLL